MKYLLILLVFPLLSVSKCSEKKKKKTAEKIVVVKDSIPVCLRKLINDANNEIPPNAPVQIDEYNYNGKTVFLLTAPCCDQFNTLYDDSCKMICSPSGGITGRGDRTCDNFSKNASFVKLVWKNPVK